MSKNLFQCKNAQTLFIPEKGITLGDSVLQSVAELAKHRRLYPKEIAERLLIFRHELLHKVVKPPLVRPTHHPRSHPPAPSGSGLGRPPSLRSFCPCPGNGILSLISIQLNKSVDQPKSSNRSQKHGKMFCKYCKLLKSDKLQPSVPSAALGD